MIKNIVIANLRKRGYKGLAKELENIEMVEALKVRRKRPWSQLPKGWTQKSLDKFARTLTNKTKRDHKGFFTECVKKISWTDIKDPDSFCAGLKNKYLGN